MFIQYLKIAWRNLIKYRTQSIISIMGLAIGFTAFSFTMSWIRYEKGYDSFNPDADRIYRVLKLNEKKTNGVDCIAPEPLASYLASTYPEIEAATSVSVYKDNFEVNGKSVKSDYRFINTDTSFFHVFYPETKISYPDVLPENSTILSHDMANRIGNVKSGSEIKIQSKVLSILAICPNKSFHSNVPFDVITIKKLLKSGEEACAWCASRGGVYIRVKKNADIQKLAAKIDSVEVKDSYQGVMRYKLVPLGELHSTYPDEEATIKYNHLKIFAGVSILVILCALFNYLMLFVSRIKMRGRELALRKVNGASNRGLLFLLFVEFLLLLVAALLLGGVLTELLFPSFVKLSMIEASKSYFIQEALLFAVVMIVLAIVIAAIPIVLFTRKTIRENTQKDFAKHSFFRNGFSLFSILLQITTCVLLIFSSSIFFLQLNLLNQSDIGFDRHNVKTISSAIGSEQVVEIKKFSTIEQIIHFTPNMMPRRCTSGITIDADNNVKTLDVSFEIFEISSSEFTRFFRIKLLEGRLMHEGEDNAVLINQSAKRILGKKNVLGEKLNDFTVVGVIPDLYIDSPLLPVLPAIYRPMIVERMATMNSYAFRYREGTREVTEKALKALEEKYGTTFSIESMDDVYDKYTKSEQYLLILLGIMTGVAILIAIFGIYSMISLTCSQRRKEIAIRKVNGATAGTILMMFFKQYFMMVCMAGIIAFPIGYYIMNRWLEQYTRRINMEWWLFAGVFLLITLIVLLSILSRVLKAANENPAEVVKSG